MDILRVNATQCNNSTKPNATLDGFAQDDSAFKNVGIVFVLTLVYAVAELTGGVLADSAAIISAAVHAAGDCITMALAWVLERFALRQSDQRYSYGYRRLSLLSAVISGTIIFAASVGVLWHVLPEVIGFEFFPGGDGHDHHGHNHSPNSLGMLLLALFGLAINIASILVLRRGDTANEKMLIWCQISHLLSWIAILLAALILMFFDIPLIDQVLSVFIITFILYSVSVNLWEAIKLFLQAVPCGISMEKLRQEVLREVKGVVDMHDVRIWSLDGSSHVFSSHVVVEKNTNIEKITAIKKGIRDLIAKRGSGKFYTTIECESANEICRDKVWGKT